MKVIILGNGGHARVLKACVFPEPELLGKDDAIPPGAIVIGVGDLALRKKLYLEHCKDRYMVPVVHPAVVFCGNDALERCSQKDGVQIMAGVVIQPGVTIGVNTLINTNASIDHDCVIGAHCHIAPGVTLCGDVTIGEGSFIGAGATIVQGVKLKTGTFIPAGALVVSQDDVRCHTKRTPSFADGPPADNYTR